MADVPYLQPEEFKKDSIGYSLPTDPTGDVDTLALNSVLLRASQIVDDYTGTTWGYQQVYDEVTKWNGFQHSIQLRNKPIRVVQNFRVLVGTSISLGNSLSTGFATIPTSPTGPPWLQPGQLPTQFGYVILDRYRDGIKISMTNFNTRLIGLPWVQGLPRPEVLITYTSGYDKGGYNSDGSPYLAPDGYSLPYPTWLKEATRIIASSLIAQSIIHQDVPYGVQEARFADTTYRMYQPRSGSGSSVATAAAQIIPPEALVYLNRRHRTTLM